MKNILVAFIICILCSSCTSYAFIIDSNPEEADLNIINDKKEIVYTGKTPLKVAPKYIPKGEYIVTLNKIGYEETIVLTGNSKDLKLKNMNLGKRNLRKIE